MAKNSMKSNIDNADANAENQNENAEASTTETSAESGKKRQAKASVTYVMPDGSEKNFPNVEANVIRIETTGGTKRDYDISTMADNIKHCAMLQGVVTRFQRGYQAIKLEDDVVASIDETIADLNNGIWVEVGAGEPRVTNLITAVVMALETQGTHEKLVDGKVTAEHRKEIGEKLAADETFRKEVRERPVIAANLAKLASEAAQKRAEEKAAKAAADSGNASSGF